MKTHISIDTKEHMADLAEASFYSWTALYNFFDDCGVPKRDAHVYQRVYFSRSAIMRNVITNLEERGEHETIDALVSGFYRLKGPDNYKRLDFRKTLKMLAAFREFVGDDPVQRAAEGEAHDKANGISRPELVGTIASNEREAA